MSHSSASVKSSPSVYTEFFLSPLEKRPNLRMETPLYALCMRLWCVCCLRRLRTRAPPPKPHRRPRQTKQSVQMKKRVTNDRARGFPENWDFYSLSARVFPTRCVRLGIFLVAVGQGIKRLSPHIFPVANPPPPLAVMGGSS